jgi:hypothetical protein
MLIGGVHVVRDITTHKETEKALRESEENGEKKSGVLC